MAGSSTKQYRARASAATIIGTEKYSTMLMRRPHLVRGKAALKAILRAGSSRLTPEQPASIPCRAADRDEWWRQARSPFGCMYCWMHGFSFQAQHHPLLTLPHTVPGLLLISKAASHVLGGCIYSLAVEVMFINQQVYVGSSSIISIHHQQDYTCMHAMNCSTWWCCKQIDQHIPGNTCWHIQDISLTHHTVTHGTSLTCTAFGPKTAHSPYTAPTQLPSNMPISVTMANRIPYSWRGGLSCGPLITCNHCMCDGSSAGSLTCVHIACWHLKGKHF
jgi:hypothetical protein